MTTLQTTTQTISELLIEARGTGSKAAAARQIGVSRQIYDAWESGHFVPGDDWVQALMEYLGRPEDEIVWVLYKSRLAKNRLFIIGLTAYKPAAVAA